MIRLATLPVALLCLIANSAFAEQQFAAIGDLELESGDVLNDVRLGYITAGTLNEDKSNTLVFLTWFGGTSQRIVDWGHVGPGKLADTDRYFVVVIDALANGVSTSPSNSRSQAGAAFPQVTIGDMVNSQYRLLTEHLDIHHVHGVLGISMGAVQTYDWIARYPQFMDKAVAIDGSPQPTSHDLLVFGVRKRIIPLMREAGHSDEEISSVIEHVDQLTLRTPDWFIENIEPGEIDEFLAHETSIVFESFDYEAQLDAVLALNLLGETESSQRQWAERVQADVLIINELNDRMVHPSSAQLAAKLLGAWSVMTTSNCGHLANNICEAVATRDEVHDFLE